MHQKTNSQEIYERLCEVIPGGVNSPVRACQGLISPPVIAARGEKDQLFDVDGNAYIDYCGSWGPLIHGHGHPAILDAVSKQMKLGMTFGLTTEVEERLARKVVELVDSVEKVRFVSSGTEATMSAVRLARGFTGKELILKFTGHYHGHADFFLVQAGSALASLNATSTSKGIPEAIVHHSVSLRFNDVAEVQAFIRTHGHDLAAVILEPVAGNMGVVPANEKFMEMLRTETANAGALLIFDEVMTGFRLGKQGAQSIYKEKPDLTCFGKVIGGGLPAAAFGGRADIMDCLSPLGSVFQAGTLSGNPLAMAAGYVALSLLEEPGYFEELERKTRLITDPVKEHIKKSGLSASLQQIGSMFTLFFGVDSVKNMDDAKKGDHNKFKAFFIAMLEEGIYMPPSAFESWFVSMAHTDEHLERTRNAIIKHLIS